MGVLSRTKTMMRAPVLPLIALAAALSLTACDRSTDAEVAKLDNQIIANDTDPALTSALEDQIMVDPALTQQSNKNAVRASSGPAQAQYPLPAGGAQPKGQASAAASTSPGARASGGSAPAARTASAGTGDISGIADCGPKLSYNAGWARRLPAAFPIFPGSRITDAAGSDSADCRARVVTFTTDAPPQRVLDYYRSRAAGAGYSAEHQMRQGDHILAGTAGGAAYYLILTPRGGGSDVAMITNGG
jgi:hypothetical protein